MADIAEDAADVKVEQNGETATTDAAVSETPEVKAKQNGEETVKPETTEEKIAEDTKADTTAEKRKNSPEAAADDEKEHKRPRAGDRPVKSNTLIQSRFEDQPESNDADEIRRQVEFYFSDSNLPIDSFLLGFVGGEKGVPSENHPVELKTIHDFKRMRHFQPFSAVRDAVKASTFLNIDDDDQVTRKVPLDAKFTMDVEKNRTMVHQGNMSRSIYAKGFGEETKSTHLDIETFFEPYGPLKSVRLRRTGRGEFKGSVFVEFETDELQKQFLELETKPKWNGEELSIMSKQAYVEVKHEGILEGAVRPRSPIRGYGRGGKNRGSGKWDKGGSNRDRFDKDDWKSRRDRDQDDDRRERGGRGRGGNRGQRGGGRGRRGGRFDRDDDRRRRGSDAGEQANGSPDRSRKRARDYDAEKLSESKRAKVDGDQEA